jgi:hypothetical protein
MVRLHMLTLAAADLDRRVKVVDGDGKDDGSIERVGDLQAMPFVVLLGEPGIGKSTVLAREAANEGAAVISVRELMTGTEPQHNACLFLDALDEYRTDGGTEDKVHTLANAMAKYNPPRWRLTCRSEDWRKAADTGPISKTTVGRTITVVQLLPLDLDEASTILAALGEVDPEQFLKNAHAYGATGFIENPLGLKLLRNAVADGGTWPANRFQLFASATQKLAFERNAVRSVIERHGADEILDAAAEAFLLLLVSGARAIWRSNNEPPSVGDARAYVTGHDLKIDRNLLGDALDTPLFRGEGETFEPMHRTIAEFLAGRALASAVHGSTSRPALPLDRALALVTGDDASPPTELRGLFAWFAAHLAVGGDASSALRLIAADPVTVLSYGDAAVLETSARRALLNGLGHGDPYFRASEVGVTTAGGLAGEDLAEDFAAILTDSADGTHRLLTVFEALTLGQPVRSLQPLLRALILDPTRPEWQRSRAIEAYLNGAENPPLLRRELFDALVAETASVAREAVRARLAGHFSPRELTVADVRSVLADYRRCKADNMMGRLYSLQKRLETEPMPELFDDPIATWLPARNTSDQDHYRDRGIEISHLLDHALAAAIRSEIDLPAATLWRWTVNVRRETWSELKDETVRALAGWLNKGPEREVAFFDEILKADDGSGGPWLAGHKYIRTARRQPSDAIIQHLLARAAANAPGRNRLLAIAVEVAVDGQHFASYWATYDQVILTGDTALLNRLTVSTIDEWRRDQADRGAEGREEEERERINAIEVLRPVLSDIAVGQYPQNLNWAAQLYFERDGSPDVQRVVEKTDAATTVALLAGWNHIATRGLGEVDAASLGIAEAEQRRYHIESAAVAGIYRLLSDGKMPALGDTPIEVALAVLKSSWTANGIDRQEKLDRWAIDRLNFEPVAGARTIVEYWNAALGAGAKDLVGIWKFQEENASGAALKLALETILTAWPMLAPVALRTALKASVKALSRRELIELSRAAIEKPGVDDASMDAWRLVAFVLDPVANAALLVGEDGVALFLDEANGELVGALSGMVDIDRLPTLVLKIRAFGPRAAPRDESGYDGRVTEPQRLSETIRNALNALAGDSRSEAGVALADLANTPELMAWHPSIRHAQAQQRRLMRDRNFKHPTAAAVRAALDCGPPVNASDLRAVVTSELNQLRGELRSADTTPWKRYWNVDSDGKVTKPLIENECRDHLLDRLRDRLKKYQIAAALPEARRGAETRVDMLALTGAGRNLPVEAKRHFHPDIWVAAATQLQGYAATPGADGLGIYLVFWFGNDAHPTPARPDGSAGPSSGAELEAMLITDLPADLRYRTDVVVFDVSNPSASVVKKPRRKKAAR